MEWKVQYEALPNLSSWKGMEVSLGTTLGFIPESMTCDGKISVRFDLKNLKGPVLEGT